MTWLVGLVTLPLWLYPIGRRGAIARGRLDAPHRHPRPATDPLAPKFPAPHDARAPPAFVAGYAATAGDAPDDPHEIPRLLEERYEVIGELDEAPAPDVPYRVSLVGAASGERAAGGPSCDYDRGVVAGLFARLLGAPVEVDEAHCRATGAGRCAFDVRVPAGAPRPDVARPPPAVAWATRLLRWVEPSATAARRRAADAAAAHGSVQRSRNRS